MDAKILEHHFFCFFSALSRTLVSNTDQMMTALTLCLIELFKESSLLKSRLQDRALSPMDALIMVLRSNGFTELPESGEDLRFELIFVFIYVEYMKGNEIVVKVCESLVLGCLCCSFKLENPNFPRDFSIFKRFLAEVLVRKELSVSFF